MVPDKTKANRMELPPGTTTLMLDRTGLTPVAVMPDTVPLAASDQPDGGAVDTKLPVMGPANEVVLVYKLTVLLLLVAAVHWPIWVI
jgi:hypothetical protein